MCADVTLDDWEGPYSRAWVECISPRDEYSESGDHGGEAWGGEGSIWSRRGLQVDAIISVRGIE